MDTKLVQPVPVASCSSANPVVMNPSSPPVMNPVRLPMFNPLGVPFMNPMYIPQYPLVRMPNTQIQQQNTNTQVKTEVKTQQTVMAKAISATSPPKESPQPQASTSQASSDGQKTIPHAASSQYQNNAAQAGAAEGQNKKTNKILVTGYPAFTQFQELIRIFTRFGPLSIDKFNPRFCTIAFAEEKQALEALKADKLVNIYGDVLSVKLYYGKASEEPRPQSSPKKDYVIAREKAKSIDPRSIVLLGDFHQQVDNVLAAVRLTPEAVTALSQLYSDVENVLQIGWPGCKTVPFGSITTGLGVKSSDADCFVEVPPHLRHPHINYVNKAKKILQQYPRTFSEIVAIPRASTPIVKFFHIPTDTNCDLTFKNPLGAQNSKLISFLLHSDPRLVPIAVIIKYWAKVHDLSGTGKLTNYALTMMIIFYLQQPGIAIVPPIEWLQRDPANDFIIEFWNTGFMDQRKFLPSVKNKASIAELLGGFFEFYAAFNFDEFVICPYLGVPLKKEHFKNLVELPAGLARYRGLVAQGLALRLRAGCPLVVQDPLEQTHNVASAVSLRLATEIRAYLQFAAAAYRADKDKQCRQFLPVMLLQKPKMQRPKNNIEYRINLFPRILMTITDPDWKTVVRNVIFKIFEDILKIKLGKMEEKVNPDSKKQKEKYYGVVTKPIWKRKGHSRPTDVPLLDFGQIQERITEEIIKKETILLNIKFQLTLIYCSQTKSTAVGLRCASGNPEEFKDLGKFFMSTMQNWFVELVKPFTKPPNKDIAAKIEEAMKVRLSQLNDPNMIDLDSDDEKSISETPGKNNTQVEEKLVAEVDNEKEKDKNPEEKSAPPDNEDKTDKKGQLDNLIAVCSIQDNIESNDSNKEVGSFKNEGHEVKVTVVSDVAVKDEDKKQNDDK